MLAFDLFNPLAQDGAIFSLRPTSRASYAPFRWDVEAHRWEPVHMPMDRFMAMSMATLSQLRAAGLGAECRTGR